MRTAIGLWIAFAAIGCNASDAKPTENRDKNSNAASTPADNTKKNERDRGEVTLTPGDQGENETDRTITQRIRQGVVKEDALSMTAKNIKIITVNSVVTLRGPVKSDKEKADIATIAQGVEGVKRVDNQLEIAAP